MQPAYLSNLLSSSSSLNPTVAKIVGILAQNPVIEQSAKKLQQDFVKEITAIAATTNPPVTADMNYILVLSGRGSYLKNPIDAHDVADPEDDHERMRLGMQKAREITALRLHKNVEDITNTDISLNGPTIIYNGRPEHNLQLETAFASGVITDFPRDKMLILDLPPDKLHTLGHFISIQQHKDTLNLDGESIGLVSSAYHLPRIGRIIGTEPPANYLGNGVKVTAFLVDREFKRPGIENDLLGEAKRIVTYTKKGDLQRSIYPGLDYGARSLGKTI